MLTSCWRGRIHEAAFAYWPGTITGNTRSSEVVSSLDLVPTLSALAGVALPSDRVFDGKDMSHILLDNTGTAKSLHDFLFFYGGCSQDGPSAVRHGQYKVGKSFLSYFGLANLGWCLSVPCRPVFFDCFTHLLLTLNSWQLWIPRSRHTRH